MLPVSINLGSLEDDPWNTKFCPNPEAKLTNEMNFALALTARILFDRYQFRNLNEVFDAMVNNQLHIERYIPHFNLPRRLIWRALQTVRREANNVSFDQVLVIVDECATATQRWPQVGERSVFADLVTENKLENEVNVFLSSLHILPFEGGGGPSPSYKMAPLNISNLEADEIRDKWLKLSFVNQDLHDKATRLLSVLAPLPGIISGVKEPLRQLAGGNYGVTVGDVYSAAQREFSNAYTQAQSKALKSVSYETLEALVFGKCIRLSDADIELVNSSFLLNSLEVESSIEIHANHISPESSAFILAQTLTDDINDSRVKTMLTALRNCGKNIIEALLKEEPGEQRVGHTIRAVFAEWLDVRLLCTLLSGKASCSPLDAIYVV
jgi:hypothetical protein